MKHEREAVISALRPLLYPGSRIYVTNHWDGGVVGAETDYPRLDIDKLNELRDAVGAGYVDVQTGTRGFTLWFYPEKAGAAEPRPENLDRAARDQRRGMLQALEHSGEGRVAVPATQALLAYDECDRLEDRIAELEKLVSCCNPDCGTDLTLPRCPEGCKQSWEVDNG